MYALWKSAEAPIWLPNSETQDLALHTLELALEIVGNATVETFNEAPGRPVVRQRGGIIDIDILEIELGR